MVLIAAAWGLVGQAIGVQPGNAHVLPNHYPTSVALILVPVWAVATGWGVTAHHRRRNYRQRTTGGARPEPDAAARGTARP